MEHAKITTMFYLVLKEIKCHMEIGDAVTSGKKLDTQISLAGINPLCQTDAWRFEPPETPGSYGYVVTYRLRSLSLFQDRLSSSLRMKTSFWIIHEQAAVVSWKLYDVFVRIGRDGPLQQSRCLLLLLRSAGVSHWCWSDMGGNQGTTLRAAGTVHSAR
ncbi:hypothetical protein EMCRGX_G019924 [Ephydatia muelleri]